MLFEEKKSMGEQDLASKDIFFLPHFTIPSVKSIKNVISDNKMSRGAVKWHHLIVPIHAINGKKWTCKL